MLTLTYDISRATRPKDGATVAVLLHGRGSHSADLQGLRSSFPENWALVTPQGPHPGNPWGYGHGWAWYQHLEEDQVVEDTLSQSLEALDAFLMGLRRIVGFVPGRIVLGGFSQGGTTSMTYALTHPGSVMAALNLSGFLPNSIDIPVSDLSPNSTPIFWGHGLRDHNVPMALAISGRARLNRAGVPLVARDYEIGHWIIPEEIADSVEFVELA